MNDLHTSIEGQTVMHFYEKCVLKAYPDPYSEIGKLLQSRGLWQNILAGGDVPKDLMKYSGKPWTIGWGTTGVNVVPGLEWTQLECDQAFLSRLATEFEPGVKNSLTTEPTQSQFDGMVSFAYNLGVGNFRSSSIVKRFNAGDIDGAAKAFLMWIQANHQDSLGLYRRRTTERLLFLGSDAQTAIAQGQAIIHLPPK